MSGNGVIGGRGATARQKKGYGATDESLAAILGNATSGGLTGGRQVTLTVVRPQVAQAAVMDQVLGGGASLTADQERFLDLLGNHNGRLDIGDVRAWLRDQGLPGG